MGIYNFSHFPRVIAGKIPYMVEQCGLLKESQELLYLKTMKMFFWNDHIKTLMKKGYKIETQNMCDMPDTESGVSTPLYYT